MMNRLNKTGCFKRRKKAFRAERQDEKEASFRLMFLSPLPFVLILVPFNRVIERCESRVMMYESNRDDKPLIVDGRLEAF